MRESLPAKVRRRLRMTASSAALWSPDKLAYRAGVRRPQELTLPDFLGLGAQKAGSTWLARNLRCHPDVFLSKKKELHYFNLYFYTSLASYAAQFHEGVGRVKGEITPAYGILPTRTLAFIRQMMPDLKLILILRNPIDRAWSRAKMRLREPGDREIDLSKFSRSEVRSAVAHPSSLARGDYLTIINNWQKFFPPEQMHICFYDDLSSRPQDFLVGVFEFLGVRTDVEWPMFPFNVVPNPTPKTPIPAEYRELLEGLYREEIEALHGRFGAKVETWRCPPSRPGS